MSDTGNMKTIAEIQAIVNSKYTFIPLLQRNYKWSRECASELAEDLWAAFRNNRSCYQLNMITIYKDESNDALQILDGQQRMITLKLFLTVLDPVRLYLNFDFERDYSIDERSGRRHFINHILTEIKGIEDCELSSVDILRLRENYNAMRIPLSFKTVYDYYCKLLSSGDDSGVEKQFQEGINDVVKKNLYMYFDSKTANLLYDGLKFDESDIEKVYGQCIKFQETFTNPESDEDISNDEIRVSAVSDEFQSLWIGKVLQTNANVGNLGYNDPDKMAEYILNNVEMLYHETSSEPIEEFLNINENKTRFVISDYIRAHMISDNPIEGEGIGDEEINKNKENRKETLELFADIAEYLYSEEYDKEYEILWKLIKTRYDDFDKHPDINRMKVVFCDKYVGTSTKNYKFEEELNRLRYFKDILDALKTELGVGSDRAEKTWNTYNAVYMLLECKKKYRFFSLFSREDIEKKVLLPDVVAREKFCFFEEAYSMAKSSEDPWDLSYFLESQLYDKECSVKKCKDLPGKKELGDGSEWVCRCRGEDNDELNACLKELIQKIKSIE